MRAYLARRIRLLSDTAYWRTNSARIQRGELISLLNQASRTEFGRQKNFARLAALPHDQVVDAYRQEIPLADWYAFRSQIARMREGGEPDILWPGLVSDFAQTSGTTAGDKFIPVSKAMLRSNFRASLDIFANLARFGIPLSWATGGRILFLGGSSDLAASDKGIRTGDLSGIVTPLIKWPLTEVYLPGAKIALMSHWPSKIDAMAARCLNEDVRIISGMCSWGLVLMERVMQMARERGKAVRTIRDVWPNFSVFIHGGVKYAPFDPRVRQIFSGRPDGDDLPCRIELYPASEGFLAIQDVRGDPGMRLNTDIGVFYEFVPLEEIDRPDARAFTCEQVEKGQKYVVAMTTCAGLWRYVLGDVVEFDTIPSGLNGRGGYGPCRLRIVGRHRHFINAFGENLIVEHIENAVASAASASGIVIGEFTAAPVYPAAGGRAGLELAVEIEGKHPADASMMLFRDAFDASLKEQNVDYTTKRTDDLGMAPPTITPLIIGAFHRWMESRGKLGGQHKCPRCMNGRDIIEGVKQLAGANRS
ncbi:MAG: GH3 auxin-responsive promoter family protein [Phycisphaerales bacterium]|nr:GH3 auxin-responsive promoter family protein [Phycisphaerales bacterium]